MPPGFSADPSLEEAEPETPNPPRRYRRQDSLKQDQYNFGKLREEAWIGFLEGSQQFHDAHFERTIPFRERFVLALKRLGEFFLRIFRVVGRSADWAEPGAEAVGSISHRISGNPKPSPRPKMRAGMDRNPGQGSQRTLPVSSFVLDWERHFDAAQALREVVTP